jgi:cystinosin
MLIVVLGWDISSHGERYIPQVLLNSRRKSTIGWSIWNILLDFTGGVLSVLQLVFDCTDLKDFSGISGNPAKFGLGFVSIIFDVVFMVQHYCLYAHPGVENQLLDEQREPLLPNRREVAATSEQHPASPENEELEDGRASRRAETIMV